MAIDLYYMPASAPCRSVMLTAHALNLQLNLKLTELSKGEHLTMDFIKMNPRHCIPTIDDDGFVLSESRAIICYLVDQYGKDDLLYPKDPKKRAIVNQRLFFDCGTLHQRFCDLYNFRLSLMTAHENPSANNRLEEAFSILDKYLDGQKWTAGEDITIADFALVATVSSVEAFGFEMSRYPNVLKWLADAKENISGYEEINHSGCMEYKRLYDIAVVRTANTVSL